LGHFVSIHTYVTKWGPSLYSYLWEFLRCSEIWGSTVLQSCQKDQTDKCQLDGHCTKVTTVLSASVIILLGWGQLLKLDVRFQSVLVS